MTHHPLTFLFTDLEGSTRLWEQFPAEMRQASARHDALMREIIEQHRGRVVKTTGDGFHVAFESPSDGVAAALAGQQAITAEPWPEATGPLKVRMGLHTGESQAREGDYYGAEVNRAARVMGIGHGGQILVSEVTAMLIRDSLLHGVALADLGQHRLKGLTAPEQIFQLCHPALTAEFPPLTSLETFKHNLPVQLTSFIGREKELVKVKQLLTQTRLLTLLGPGGTGKTRLGLQVAAELMDEYENGVFFISLALIRDPALVVSTIAQIWDLQESGKQRLVERVKDYLQDKQILLVLDNFEHVLDAGLLATGLLADAPRLKILVTSREPLRVYGEHNFFVPPLSLPETNNLPQLKHLLQYEAVGLFVERAQAVKSDFVINDDNARAIAEICQRLDGLPLAIELATARIRLLPPQAMLTRMKRRIPLLTGGARDLPSRQQTLNNAISWSHDLLNEGEKLLFRRLAVFASATLEAVETICNADSDLSSSLFDVLESLVHKSLLNQVETAGEPRFIMLETIREYALIKLEESRELEKMRDEHLDFFLKLTEQANAELMGPRQASWMARLEQERDNLRAVLEWSLNEPERITIGAKVVLSLVQFWQLRGDNEEWSTWFDLALDKSTKAPTLVRANLLEGKGFQTFHQGFLEQARHLFDQSSALYLEAEDTRSIGRLMIFQAHIALGLGDTAQALRFAGRSLEIHREVREPWWTSSSLFALGDVAYLRDDLLQAQAHYEESLSLIRDLGIGFGIARRKIRLGQTALALGETTLARTHLIKGLILASQASDNWGVAMALGGFGCLAKVQAQLERATRLFGATQAQLDAFGSHFWPLDQYEFDLVVASIRPILSLDSFKKIWDEGQAMTIEEAIELALKETP